MEIELLIFASQETRWRSRKSARTAVVQRGHFAPPIEDGGVASLHDSLDEPAECAISSFAVCDLQAHVKNAHEGVGRVFDPCCFASRCPRHTFIHSLPMYTSVARGKDVTRNASSCLQSPQYTERSVRLGVRSLVIDCAGQGVLATSIPV